ncbi:MAG: RHS repeat domain-containing protein [Bryobacteraceae bacterium]|jgi:YD repeat-containing protein
MMRRAAFVLWAAVALSRVLSGQTQVLTPGVAVQGQVGLQAPAYFDFYDTPGDAVLIRVLSLSQDRSLQFTVTWNYYQTGGFPQAIQRYVYTVPNPTAGLPPVQSVGPAVTGATFGGEYDLPGASQGYYTIMVFSQNQVAGNFLLVYNSLEGKCSSSNPSCSVVPLNCGSPALNQQIGSPPATGAQQPASPWLQINNYQFQANPGDILSVRVAKYASQTMPLAPGFNLGLFAYDSSGHLLYLNSNTSQLAAVEAGPAVTERMDVPAPADGIVNIVVFDVDSQTGNYGIAVATLNHPCSNKSLTCGSASQGSLANPLTFDSYSAPLSAGATISIRTAIAGAASSLVPVVEVYDPTGSPVPSAQSVGTATFKTSLSGNYTVLVESSTYLQTGGYAVAYARLDAPCYTGGPSPQALSCASVVTGSITGTLQTISYSVAAQANDAFLLRLEQTSPGSAFSPRVDIYGPQGNPIPSTSTSSLARLNFTVPADGSYTLSVSDGSVGGGHTGTYSLSLVRLNRPCNAATLGCGALATGNISSPLAFSVYTYAAAAGESFTLRMLGYNGALQPDLEVYDSQGDPVGQSTSGNVTGVDVTQPAGGAYTVVAMDGGPLQAGGPFGVELLRTKNACSAASPQGQTVNGVINGAEAFISYSVPATNGDALMVRSASLTPGFAAQMDLYDPTGARLNSSTFELSQTVSATGSYTVVVGPSAPATAGGYALSWQLLNNPAAASALQCGGSTTASLSAANQFRYYLAAANAGDLIRLIFTKISASFSPQIELFGPTGTRLAATSSISQKANAGGTYLVVVSPSTASSAIGSFTVAFQRPNNPCSPATLTCGQPTLRQVAIPGQLDTFVFADSRGGQADIKLASRSGSYSPYAELYDSSGNQLTTSPSGQLTAVIFTTGTYTLLVHDLSGVNLGSYRATFQDDYNPCTITDTEPPVVTLLKPTAGEVIVGNTTYRIQWQSDDNVGVVSQNIALSTDGGQTFPTTIASGLAGNAQTYNWYVPANIAPSRTAVIQVTAADAAGNAQSASSGLVSLIGSGFTANSTPAYSYDSLNRLTQAVLGDGRTITYTWDAAGNLVQITVSGQ